jgi:hypothetical protein
MQNSQRVETSFENYIVRHGEFGVQAIIEKLERYENIHSENYISLEERWENLMRCPLTEQPIAA